MRDLGLRQCVYISDVFRLGLNISSTIIIQLLEYLWFFFPFSFVFEFDLADQKVSNVTHGT